MQRLAHAVRFEYDPSSETLRTCNLIQTHASQIMPVQRAAASDEQEQRKSARTTILPLLTMRFTQDTNADFLAGALPVHARDGAVSYSAGREARWVVADVMPWLRCRQRVR